jgi:hypothetical protein
MDLIDECINIDGFYSTKRYGATKNAYANNEFLIRTKLNKKIGKKDPIPETYFNNFLSPFKAVTKKLNPADKYFKKNITCETVYDSGLFSRLYNYEKDHGIIKQNDYEILSNIGRIDINNQSGLLQVYQDYSAWKKHFYNM